MYMNYLGIYKVDIQGYLDTRLSVTNLLQVLSRYSMSTTRQCVEGYNLVTGLLPARASEQGNVIGSVRIYIYIYIYVYKKKL